MSKTKVNNMVAFLKKSASEGGVEKEAEHKKGTPNPQQQPGGDGTVKSHKSEHKEDKDAAHEKQDLPPDEKPDDNEGKKLEDKELNPSGIKQPGENKGGEPKASGLSVKSAALIQSISARVDNIRKQANEKSKGEGTEKKASAEDKQDKKPEEGVEKKAEDSTVTTSGITFNEDMLIKLAKTLVSTEEGAAKAQAILEKQEGREAAANLIKAAAEQSQENLRKEQYIGETTHKCAQHIVKLANALDPQCSEEEADFILKSAAMHEDWQNKSDLDFSNEMLKKAYAEGMQDAAGMEDSMAAGEEAASIPGGGAEVTPEDIAMILEEAVTRGDITPEEAEAILAQLLGGAGEAPAAAPEEVPAEEPAPAM